MKSKFYDAVVNRKALFTQIPAADRTSITMDLLHEGQIATLVDQLEEAEHLSEGFTVDLTGQDLSGIDFTSVPMSLLKVDAGRTLQGAGTFSWDALRNAPKLAA